MRGTRHTEEQIIAILKQAEGWLKTVEVCRQHGITEETLYRWKAKYGGMDARSTTPKATATEGGKPEAKACGGGANVG